MTYTQIVVAILEMLYRSIVKIKNGKSIFYQNRDLPV